MVALEGTIKNNEVILSNDISAYNGNTVIITILDKPITGRKRINLDSYARRTERGQHVDEYMQEIRGNDRI